MRREIAILILEDLWSDAELVKCELRRGGVSFAARRVDTREAFARALDEFRPDLVLSDNSLPSFRGLEALALARSKRPDLPFILISGHVGEAGAAEAFAAGVTDIVLKDDLSPLVASIQGALRKVRGKAGRARPE